jgi:hypothetical protein
MSLDPRDSRRRERSRSPGRRDDRERSTSRVRAPRAPSPPSSRYDDDDDDPRDRGYEYKETTTVRSSRDPAVVTAEPRDYRYAGAASKYRTDSPLGARDPYAIPGAYKEKDVEEVKVRYGDRREKDYYSETTYGRKDEYGRPVPPPERARYEAETYKYADPRDRERERERDPRRYEEEKHSRERAASFNLHAGHTNISAGIKLDHDSRDRPGYVPPPPTGYGHPPVSPYGQPYAPPPALYGAPPESPPSRHSYAEPKKWEYAQPDEKITYTRRTESTSYGGRPASPPQAYGRKESDPRTRHSSYGGDYARSSKGNVVTVEPGARPRREPSPGPGLAPRMHSLSVSTGHHGGAALSLAAAPGSPLLESYHGTYQSISPMPSPLMIPATSHTDMAIIETISPLNSDDERGGAKRGRRTARFHDPQEEATILAKALKGEKRAPDVDPLIEILPGLTHEQVLELRVEYKKIVKTGSEKKGVNIAKHIKLRLKEEDPSLMKACYACALGKWESEAYWANFWYQGEKSRRELLIESLMGRTNREIREIKDGFSDKKYGDSLTKCMKTELKEDKFKKAVLLVLEEKKMEERPGYGLDMALVEDDVHDLHRAVRAEKGGESAMINIIVVRSDAHLREILRLYETTYRANFAREMLKKSGNLVVRPLSSSPALPFCIPSIPTNIIAGRTPSPHLERRNQQARTRRTFNKPRPQPLEIRQH